MVVHAIHPLCKSMAVCAPAWPGPCPSFASAFFFYFLYQAMPHPAPVFVLLPRRRLDAALLCACLFLGLSGASGAAHAERKKAAPTSGAAAAAPETKKKGSVKIKHQRSPSEESTAERERRLYRECRGRPNAGACLGYAHGRP